MDKKLKILARKEFCIVLFNSTLLYKAFNESFIYLRFIDSFLK